MRTSTFVITLLLAIATTASVRAQSETSAFYIYQNDGHFDGFFYDQVQKITLSKLDTLGIEHEDYVSQEIITADSTYRIMLTAIDSVGFVQPEVKMNPRLRYIKKPGTRKVGSLPVDPVCIETGYEFNSQLMRLRFVDVPRRNYYVPEEYYPVVGDVFADFNTSNGFAVKITKVERYTEGSESGVQAFCEDITNINDIIHQYIAVEEIEADRSGNLIRRRVAGHPEMTVGSYGKRRTEGSFEGDLFNFTLNGHIPIVNTEKFKVSIDPSISGALSLKCTWRIPLIGSTYISIEDKLKVEASVGVTASGQLADKCYGGFGIFGQFYVPATAPLLVIDLGPDGFIRGQANINLSFTSPPAKSAIWEKWEIKNWWPYYSHGYGDPDKPESLPDASKESSSKKLTLSGFIQGGVNFPMKLKSVPLLKKVFEASLGGEWFIGPKLSGEVSIDLGAEYPTFNYRAGTTTGYSLLKGAKLSMSLLDADYEISAEVSSLFSPKKKWTIADGTFTLLSSMEICPVPEFSECTEKTETRIINGKSEECRVFSFTPSGNVFKPVKIGVEKIMIEGEDGTPIVDELTQQGAPRGQQERSYPYYQTETLASSLSGNEAINKVEYCDNIHYNGKFKVRPFVEFMGNQWSALPEYEFLDGAYLKYEQKELYINYDGTVDEPIKFTGTCDDLFEESNINSTGKLPDYIKVEGSGDNMTLSIKQEEYLKKYGKHYSLKTTGNIGESYWNEGYRVYRGLLFGGLRHMSDEKIAKTSQKRFIPFFVKPNDKEDPVATSLSTAFNIHSTTTHGNITFPGLPKYVTDIQIQRIGKQGWNCTATYEDGDETMNYAFDVTEDDDGVWHVQNGNLNYQFTVTVTDHDGEDHTIVGTLSGTFGGNGENNRMEVKNDAFKNNSYGITSNITWTVTDDGKVEESTSITHPMILVKAIFADGVTE